MWLWARLGQHFTHHHHLNFILVHTILKGVGDFEKSCQLELKFPLKKISMVFCLPLFYSTDIKLYMQKSIQHDEVKVLISATLAIPNCDIQEEILQLILQLLTSGDHTHQLGQSLMLMGTPLLTLLHSKSNLVRQTVTKVNSIIM